MERWHSLLGAGPLALFVTFHVLVNASALLGQGGYQQVSAWLDAAPGSVLLELLFVWLPLLGHGSLGLRIALGSSWTLERRPTHERWRYLLVRLTGVITLAFVVWHSYTLRWPRLTGVRDSGALHSVLQRQLSSVGSWGVPWAALCYVLGLAAASYHLARGIGSFAARWSTPEQGARVARVERAGVALGVLLFVLGTCTVVRFATGSIWS